METYIDKHFPEIKLQNSTGIGILDIYEYYNDSNHKNKN